MRVFSFGGGVQSTAALVLAAQGKLEVDAFLFANVGDDSENPGTLEYMRQVTAPYAEKWAIPLHELRRYRKDGSAETLLDRIKDPRRKGVPIPIRMSNGAPGNRKCTYDFKVQLIHTWLYRRGARAKKPAQVMLGISLDEFQRMNVSRKSYIENVYPLIDLRMNRQDCMNVISGAGLPIPPKSSCWFCPFHRVSTWQEMKRDNPGLFKRAAELEDFMNERRQAIGRDKAWLTDRNKPLRLAVGDGTQPSLFGDDMCESGYCMV